MQLSNSDYNRVMRDYDSKQYKSNLLYLERKRKLYESIPELKLLDEEITTSFATLAKDAIRLSSEDFSLQTKLLSKKKKEIRDKKLSLMKKHGFAFDYLTDIYECPDCKDTGFIDSQKCHCFNRTTESLFKNREVLTKLPENAKFSLFNENYYSKDDFHPETGKSSRDNALQALKQAKDFVKNFNLSPLNMLIYGNTGTGKTFLAGCIANELITEGTSVSFVTAFQFYNLFETVRFKKAEQDDLKAEDSIRTMMQSDLLVLDDIGTEVVNNFTLTKLYEVINDRLTDKKSTIITTNFDLTTIKKVYSERILSRLVGHYQFTKLTGNDIRFIMNLKTTD